MGKSKLIVELFNFEELQLIKKIVENCVFTDTNGNFFNIRGTISSNEFEQKLVDATVLKRIMNQ